MTNLPAATATDYGLRPEPRQPSPFWTEAEFASLKELTAQGLSASQIAAQMPGRSRNSIIGKQHRMEVRSHNAKGGSIAGTRTPRERSTARCYKRAPWAVEGLLANGKQRGAFLTELPREVVANPVTFAALQDNQCRWPVDSDPTLFCGGQILEKYPYCVHHCCMAYQTAARPSADRAGKSVVR
jgi:GcrA cell cycle regulator